MSEAQETIRVRPLTAERIPDFYRLHGPQHDAAWCSCVAWWVPTWEGWGERSAEQNRRLREELFALGQHDGFLLYEGSEPVGWCQVGPRDRLHKLRAQFGLEPDPETWAISCFLIAPSRRRRGLAARLLRAVLEALRQAGVRRVEAYPKRGADDAAELWNGPEAMFRACGFRVQREDAQRPVLALELRSAGGRPRPAT